MGEVPQIVACWCFGPHAREGTLCLRWGQSVDGEGEGEEGDGVLSWMHKLESVVQRLLVVEPGLMLLQQISVLVDNSQSTY